MKQAIPSKKVRILGPEAVEARLRRIAYEIYEANYGEEELVLLGIDQRGGYIASRLFDLLQEISPIKVHLLRARKLDPEPGVKILEMDAERIIRDRTVLIVDDVLYSGRTLFHAIASVMECRPARVETAVLIDRGHRNVPVTHDFVGVLLATSLQQHVSVEISLENDTASAYLL